jgi:hypothetical protein
MEMGGRRMAEDCCRNDELSTSASCPQRISDRRDGKGTAHHRLRSSHPQPLDFPARQAKLESFTNQHDVVGLGGTPEHDVKGIVHLPNLADASSPMSVVDQAVDRASLSSLAL